MFLHVPDARPPRRALALFLLALGCVALLVAAPTAAIDPRLVAPADGPSGLKWIGGNKGSEFMRPGADCITCHQQGREGPQFLVAGTVYTKINEPDDYLGVEGVVVQLTDAAGKVLKLSSNKAGNFMSGKGAAVKMPYSAKLLYKGAERAMMARQATGNCAMCHTSKGAGGAPGRIMIP
jgi:mono/diheme cytochrome c family protein